eukprot:GEMP01076331.1.p1 GENE.GEMP01076331.1~~GEMP01076331.1.p1  ORF type:complete len:127 (+),score=19.96 GEMP01076331.1:569-949(+)
MCKLGTAPVNLRKVRDGRGSSATHFAAMCSNVGFVTYVLPLINSRDREGWAPLRLAAWLGRRSTVQHLVKYGAFLDALGNEDKSALHYANTAGMKRTAYALVRLGAVAMMQGAVYLVPDTDGGRRT